MADAALCDSMVAINPADRPKPRRVSRRRNFSLARDSRDKMVPFGQPRITAASSFVLPSM